MTECNAQQLEFHGLGRRLVVGGFNGGAISSDGGALPLRETEQRTGILARLAAQFDDHRDPQAIEHTAEELISQGVLGIAVGYEDLNDHNHLRADQLLALAVGKDDPGGQDRERARDQGKALASSSTLNRLELTPCDADASTRYKKIVAKPGGIDRLLVDCLSKRTSKRPRKSGWIWMPRMIQCMVIKRGASSMAFAATSVICPCISSAVSTCCAPGYANNRTSMPRPAVSRNSRGSSPRSVNTGPTRRSSSAAR